MLYLTIPSLPQFINITHDICLAFVNQGGFNMLGSGRTKIESEKEKKTALAVCRAMRLDGLVVVGGDDSNTNAAILAEYFLGKGVCKRIRGSASDIGGLPEVHMPFFIAYLYCLLCA